MMAIRITSIYVSLSDSPYYNEKGTKWLEL